MNLNTDDFLLMLCATFLLANLIMLILKTIFVFRIRVLLQHILNQGEQIKSIQIRQIRDDDNDRVNH